MTLSCKQDVSQLCFSDTLCEKLPEVRGRFTPNAPLGYRTWFGVGGPAEILFRPADRQDMIDFIKNCPKAIPITIIGAASNLIIRDGGIPGVVIRMGGEFSEIQVEGTEIRVGAAALVMNVALACLKESVTGLEFFSGIPGTVGGALRINAGAYGRETKDTLITAEVLFRDGSVRQMTPSEMDMSYRHNGLPKDVFFLGCTLRGTSGEYSAIKDRMTEIKVKRSETQPIKSKTGGSTFANPEGQKAWQLIDKAGCRGLKVGGAQISEIHTNFMLNNDSASASDLERLGEEVRRRDYEKSQIMLRWEIRRIGIPLEKDADILEWIKEKNV